jgi:uncharacterized protein (TIGR03437 family)
MTNRLGWGCWCVAGLLSAVSGGAQTLTNQTLTGKYFFRHVSLGTDGSNPANLPDPRSLLGTITFDGSGHYSVVGQQVTGTAATVAQTSSGAYSVDPGGFVALDSPLRTGAKINARYGAEAVIGSSTESADNTYDLFVAIPAPAANAVFTGPYNFMSLEFPGGATANVRSNQFSLNNLALGNLAGFTVNGHSASISQGRLQTQQVTGATYAMGADGTGSFTVGSVNLTQLLSGTKTLYLSASGNILLGGTAGSHDIFIGVKPLSGATNASWNATFFGAGLRVDSTAFAGYSGALAAHGAGKLTWTKRFKAMGTGAFDFTGINSYTLSGDGTGSVDLTSVAVGASDKAFVGAAISLTDQNAYEIYFGVQVPSLSGPGVFLNPLGVLNAASSAPPGNPIAPGQFVTLYGTGLAKSTQTSPAPYPSALNGVSVQINGKAAPIYFVSAGQLNVLVPYATTGPTATIVVNNGGTNSNTVTVPVAATAPGVYTLDQSGGGAGAILHANYTLVNASSPATAGETVLIYLTGMGTVSPTLGDGTAGVVTTLYNSAIGTAGVNVLIGGQPGTVTFNGLAPGFPGLYQLNVTLPSPLPATGTLPLAISTANAYHDQVDISVH